MFNSKIEIQFQNLGQCKKWECSKGPTPKVTSKFKKTGNVRIRKHQGAFALLCRAWFDFN